ncbi:hypothetical protein GCM10025768_23570 [Microbacterium pseudoresistens]|uniref:Tetratricopeptide (TPR) repeat protein n=1 Tax=Microbacterium pseudoresistens TaxID=640634 RepID=A0A7Y9ETG8_9MICO|nr:hypothetical protein [Microbacterium pseudoresistens]NYD53652.1 tetratricopeptide (TPR) repeat protein [Microbacterium pseudoresistens]
MTAQEGSPDDAPRHDPGAVHPPSSTAPRWHPARDLNNAGADALRRGDLSEGERLLREAVALTEVADADDAARDIRARAMLNLASVPEAAGDLAEALRMTDGAIGLAAEVAQRTDDRLGTRTVSLNAMLGRCQILTAMDRLDDAGAVLDEVETRLDDTVHQAGLIRYSLHLARSTLLIIRGRLPQAEREARVALQSALAVDPQLTANVYVNLASIAQRTGDDAASQEYLELAERVSAANGDAVSRQLAAENLARAAAHRKDWPAAQESFLRAGSLAREAGMARRLAACNTGLAAIHLETNNPVQAARVLRTLIRELVGLGAVQELREAYGFLGDAESKRGKFAKAHEAYLAARDLAHTAHERCRVDVRRAEMHAEWASVTPLPRRRQERLEQARDIAVPVLLATEALRADFPPGPTRERWSLQIAAPARELAFRLAMTLGEPELLLALIENATASATLQAETIEATLPTAAEPDPIEEIAPVLPLRVPLPAPEDAAELPAAASGFAAVPSAHDGLRFAAPPRVVAIPGAEPALEPWIRVAEAEYGVAVRSDTVVAAW